MAYSEQYAPEHPARDTGGTCSIYLLRSIFDLIEIKQRRKCVRDAYTRIYGTVWRACANHDM
jgi:hypothetical protein